MELLTGLIIGVVGGYIFGKISERRHAEAYLSKKYRMRNACIRIKEREYLTINESTIR